VPLISSYQTAALLAEDTTIASVLSNYQHFNRGHIKNQGVSEDGKLKHFQLKAVEQNYFNSHMRQIE
jgi:hypothetical protein